LAKTAEVAEKATAVTLAQGCSRCDGAQQFMRQ